MRPGIDYFQGLNDLCVPFILILLSRYVGMPSSSSVGLFQMGLNMQTFCPGGDLDAINVFQLDNLSNEKMQAVEADTFWCISNFLSHIQVTFRNFSFLQV